ncbi:MAG: VOC family protein [Ignavibacteria bacterium]|jgi:predicted enzyme related to lactoylglutathione lyase
MSRVVHFEIAAKDVNKVKDFYSNVFGWKIESWGGPMDYWLVSTGDDKEMGINGAIFKKEGPQTIINTIGVKNLDESIKIVEKHGGKVSSPKNAIPGVGYFAYCEDVEGNKFGMMQPDEKAK